MQIETAPSGSARRLMRMWSRLRTILATRVEGCRRFMKWTTLRYLFSALAIMGYSVVVLAPVFMLVFHLGPPVLDFSDSSFAHNATGLEHAILCEQWAPMALVVLLAVGAAALLLWAISMVMGDGSSIRARLSSAFGSDRHWLSIVLENKKDQILVVIWVATASLALAWVFWCIPGLTAQIIVGGLVLSILACVRCRATGGDGAVFLPAVLVVFGVPQLLGEIVEKRIINSSTKVEYDGLPEKERLYAEALAGIHRILPVGHGYYRAALGFFNRERIRAQEQRALLDVNTPPVVQSAPRRRL